MKTQTELTAKQKLIAYTFLLGGLVAIALFAFATVGIHADTL